MALDFHSIFARELNVINFRRDKIRSGHVARARTQRRPPDRGALAGSREEGLSSYIRPRGRIAPPARPADPTARGSGALPTGNDLSGLALSGGGIRSASFGLGVLQALDSLSDQPEPSVLDALDYLSTVSGGGYIGTSLVAGLMQPDYTFPFDSRLDDQETPETQHLRDFSNFLAPNGLFDFLISGVLVLRGLLVNAAIVTPILLLLAIATIAFCPLVPDLSHAAIFGLPLASVHIPNLAGVSAFAVTLDVTILLAVVLVASAVWSSISFNTASLEAREWLGRMLACGLLIIPLAALFEVQPYVLAGMFADARPPGAEASAAFAWVRTVAPSLAAVLVPLVTVLVACAQRLANIAKAAVGEDSWSAAIKLQTSRFALLLAAIIVPFLLWVAYIYLSFWGIRSGPTDPYNPFTPTVIHVAGDWLAAWVPMSELAVAHIGRAGLVYTVVALGLSAICLFIGPNANSLHRLYRDRLSRAFLFERQKLAADQPSRGMDRWTFSSLKPTGPAGTWLENAAFSPYLLVNTAINLEGSHELNKRGRNADTFIFSPLHVGSSATGYVETAAMEKAVPDLSLATAMATSGAAASANMGARTIKLLTFSLSLLNIRLGYWLANPRRIADFGRPLLRWLANVGTFYFLLETAGRLDEDKLNVYLTDGGHIENLGLYELLRRRCKVIVAVDAEGDPGMTFPSFVNLEVMARIDLGIRIDLPWQAVQASALGVTDKALYGPGGRPGAQGPHAAIGRIAYGETESGVLIYIKSSLSGDENDHVLDYKRRNPTFPHETTVDQFFSEEQFEAYRALGFHAARGLFTGADGFGTPADPPPGWRREVREALALLNVPPGLAEAIASRCQS